MSAGARSQKGASINGLVGDCIVARRFMLHPLTGLEGQRSDRARSVRRMRATPFALPNAVLMTHFSGCSVLLVAFIPKRNQTMTWPWPAFQQQQVPGCYSDFHANQPPLLLFEMRAGVVPTRIWEMYKV